MRLLMFVLVVVDARWLEVGWPPGLGLLVDMGCFGRVGTVEWGRRYFLDGIQCCDFAAKMHSCQRLKDICSMTEMVSGDGFLLPS